MDSLTPLFDWLLTANAHAALLTVVVLIVQALLRHKVPARWLSALWMPVLLVLLTPAFPESPWSVGGMLNDEQLSTLWKKNRSPGIFSTFSHTTFGDGLAGAGDTAGDEDDLFF